MKSVRRTLAASLTCGAAALFPFAVVAGAQGGGAPPAPAGAASRPVPAATAALTEANRVKDPAERLAALEKVRAEYPALTQADQSILTLLATSWPERRDAIGEVLDRIVGRIPATASPDSRLSSVLSPVNTLIPRKVLLDRCEQLVADALGALTIDKYTESRRDIAKRLNQPEPSTAVVTSGFNTMRGRGLEALGRTYLAKGDTAKGEGIFKEAVALSPTYGIAATTLVDLYGRRDDFASAEQLLKGVIAASATPPAPTPTMDGGRITTTGGTVVMSAGGASGASAAMIALANLYVKHGDDQKAEATLVDAVAKAPTSRPALLALAKLERKRGADSAALGHYLLAAVLPGAMVAEDDSSMRSLFAKANGRGADLDAELDRRYHERFPNPVKPEPYVPTPNRSNRVALLEMFTGSGCPPCVSADLALEAAMQRYPEGSIVAVNYHANIPQPDPMVVAGGNGRREYYGVRGVPTFNIDGALAQLGGGPRERTQGTYATYIRQIDKALETPSGASVDVSATGKGDQVSVTAQVSNLPADTRDLRLHILLVERELRFAGENGVRFHPMVVRAVAGDSGHGIAISKNGATRQVFSLKAIREDVTGTLAAELDKRSKGAPAGAVARTYAATGHAYAAIDTSRLVVVAFLQRGAYVPPGAAASAGVDVVEDSTSARPAKVAAPPAGTAGPNVLQAALADVAFGQPAKGRNGGK